MIQTVRTHGFRLLGVGNEQRTIQAHPGATNAIPGEVRLTLDVRHKSDQIRAQSVQRLTGLAQQIAARRALSVNAATFLNQPAVAMDPFLVTQIESAIRAAGCPPHRMPSGAGHDAMKMHALLPQAMLFVRGENAGISHNPLESSTSHDIDLAVRAFQHLLDQLAHEVR